MMLGRYGDRAAAGTERRLVEVTDYSAKGLSLPLFDFPVEGITYVWPEARIPSTGTFQGLGLTSWNVATICPRRLVVV